MLGEMDQKIVATRPQSPQQSPLLIDLGHDAQPLPVTVDRVNLRDGGMARKHRFGAPVDQRIDFRPWNGAGQGRENGRSQQHVAKMAQLGHEHTMDFGKGNGVRERARHGG